MAWNEPGGNKNDPWGNNNRGGKQQPPDLDEALKQMLDKINGMFGGKKSGNGGGNNRNNGTGAGPLFGIIALIAIIVLGWMSVYTIDEQQRGVVLRLGKYEQTLEPGLKFVAPLIDKVTVVNATNVRSIEMKELMLTQDENVIEVAMEVQYRVSDPVSFALRVDNPEQSLMHAAESALRHEVGSTDMDPILTSGRTQLAVNTRERIQRYMNSYSTGIEVDKVNINDVSPPQEVKAAFDDVQSAKQDKERFGNEAETYANTVVPEARGKALRMMEDANAYKARVVAQAQGEAVRFEKLLGEYKKAPEVTRRRLYIDTVSTVYGSSNKVMVDVEGGNNMMYLPLDKIMQNQPAASSVPTDISKITDQVLEEIRQRQANTRGGR
ncbi:MAG: FtsH protease activity modulator HflK [Oceanospirillaceae bacterium]|nr:FtsH protease activity modulator HflK [Oceanospirillaceae bacterium]MCP5335667.1 FtsH protease activity modulator HflK [Oceanospirillaceae bacterium]MCP5350322.1 FtsH protease activity modulator HflK [Oceanospirillaceae bacterium]